MDYELLEKMKVKELNIYLKISSLIVTGTKKELVAQEFFCLWKCSSTCKNSGGNRMWFNH